MPVEGKPYALLNENFGCAMDVLFCDKSIGNIILTYKLWNYNNDSNQLWYISKVPGTTNYVILSTLDGLALERTGNSITQQYLTCGPKQQFSIEMDSKCGFNIRSVTTNNDVLAEMNQFADCLNLKGYVESQPFNNTKRQKWSFVEVVSSENFRFTRNYVYIWAINKLVNLGAWKPVIPTCCKSVFRSFFKMSYVSPFAVDSTAVTSTSKLVSTTTTKSTTAISKNET